MNSLFLYYNTKPLSHLTPLSFKTSNELIDTYGGQSGSGMWCQREKGESLEYYLVGVHAYGNEEEGSFNYGPRLTSHKAQEILGWIKDFKDNKLRFENKVRVAKKTLEGNVVGEKAQDTEISSEELIENQDIIADLRSLIQGMDGIEWYDWGLKYFNGTGVNRDADKAHECFAETKIKLEQGNVMILVKNLFLRDQIDTPTMWSKIRSLYPNALLKVEG